MIREPCLRGDGTVGTHGGQPGEIIGRPMRVVRAVPGVRRLQQRAGPRAIAQSHEDPATLLASLGQAGVGEDADVPGHARLALPKDMRQFADGKLHRTQQRDDPQAGRIAQGAKDLQYLLHGDIRT